MNLIYILPAITIELSLISCLKINELKIDNFLKPFSFNEVIDKDFLDVDVSSDVLVSNVAIYEASIEPVNHVEKYSFISKDGKPYTCWIEADSEVNEQVSGQHDEILKQIILNRKRSCYYYKGKTWIYEYCHLKSTRQVNRTKINGKHEEFSLGRFYPPKRGITFHRHLNHLSTEFFDGNFCPLTGLPRTSRIRFLCANDKQGMHIINVMETSACVYNFLVHVPELCNNLPHHAKIPKNNSKIICAGYTSKRTKPDNEKSKSTKTNGKLDELDKILGRIESKYKDSAVLNQYKSLLLKATEKLKSQQLAKDFAKSGSDASFLELFSKLTSPDSEPAQDGNEAKKKSQEREIMD